MSCYAFLCEKSCFLFVNFFFLNLSQSFVNFSQLSSTFQIFSFFSSPSSILIFPNLPNFIFFFFSLHLLTSFLFPQIFLSFFILDCLTMVRTAYTILFSEKQLGDSCFILSSCSAPHQPFSCVFEENFSWVVKATAWFCLPQAKFENWSRSFINFILLSFCLQKCPFNLRSMESVERTTVFLYLIQYLANIYFVTDLINIHLSSI